jgi:hypothetical protein
MIAHLWSGSKAEPIQQFIIGNLLISRRDEHVFPHRDVKRKPTYLTKIVKWSSIIARVEPKIIAQFLF